MRSTGGRALHIGLNRVDPDHYGGWDGALAGCEPDAKDMQSIAEGKGFTSTVLLNEEARSDVVLREIADAAESLGPGDIFFLTYSGHGGQVPDLNGNDEADEQDETWVLFDRQVVDDELFALWGTFAAGVRIVVLSDSCHSGSVVRDMFYAASPANEEVGARFKALPRETQDATYEAHKDEYDEIQRRCTHGDMVGIGAMLLLISGCQDNQLSRDGDQNGLFTQTLKEVWDEGRFPGSYRTLHKEIVDRMPSDQTPNYYRLGTIDPVFEQQSPFTI
ncbi:MAG TPA: caspase family protein [Actinomycetota bacterium]|nr:caspase family protein [Actinomycetota bacterium]